MKTLDWFELPPIAIEVVDEVNRTGESVLITKNGIPAVRIDPIDAVTQAEFDLRHDLR